MKNKNKYYGIYSKNGNFLYGVFPLNKDGYKKAKNYIAKISKNKNEYYIKKK